MSRTSRTSTVPPPAYADCVVDVASPSPTGFQPSEAPLHTEDGHSPPFKVVSDFAPAGDQPTAIASLAEGVEAGERFQTLLGITGSGKSATIAWTIEQVQRPTLVLAPNKSLAAQLASG